MKTFKEWYKDVSGVEFKRDKSEDLLKWCNDRGLPAIVSCTCCGSTMVIFSAFVDEEDCIYCPSCAGME